MANLIEVREEQDYYVIKMDDSKANALSFDMFEQLNTALDRATKAEKVVIITGRAGKFSAGFDLKIMAQGGEKMSNLLEAGGLLAQRLITFRTPVIIAASGHAMAMGAMMLLSVDYRIGIKGNYKIGLNEVSIGMPLPHFGVELTKARLNKNHAVKAVDLAMLYDTDGAVTAGYLDESVDESSLLSRAETVATQLARLDMNAYRITKSRTKAGLGDDIAAALQKDLSQLAEIALN